MIVIGALRGLEAIDQFCPRGDFCGGVYCPEKIAGIAGVCGISIEALQTAFAECAGDNPANPSPISPRIDAIHATIGGSGTYAQVIGADAAGFAATMHEFPAIQGARVMLSRRPLHIRYIGTTINQLNKNASGGDFLTL